MNDLISRQAAIEVIDAVMPVDPNKSEYASGIACGAALAMTYVKQLPSVQPERKNGRWIPGREIGKEILTDGTIEVAYEDYKCSSCGLILFRLLHNSDGTPFYKFCPNCGADMRGEQNG